MCAHLLVSGTGETVTTCSVRATKHPLPQGLVIVSRPRDSSPWMSSQGDPEAQLSSPATPLKQALCVQPAILLIAPLVNTNGRAVQVGATSTFVPCSG